MQRLLASRGAFSGGCCGAFSTLGTQAGKGIGLSGLETIGQVGIKWEKS